MAARRSAELARATHVVPIDTPTPRGSEPAEVRLADVVPIDLRRQRREAARREAASRRSPARRVSSPHGVDPLPRSRVEVDRPVGMLPEPLAPARWAVLGTVMLILAAVLSGQA